MALGGWGFGRDGKIVLPGRHVCQCLGAQHAVLTNCTSCGRIVCEQEGLGACVFCGSLVCTPEQRAVLDAGSASERQALIAQLMPDSAHSSDEALSQTKSAPDEKLRAAVLEKDRLIEYDQTSYAFESASSTHEFLLLMYSALLIKYFVCTIVRAKRTQVLDDEQDYFCGDSNRWLSKSERDALKAAEREYLDTKHASRLNAPITVRLYYRRTIH